MTRLEVPLFAVPFYFMRHGETESNRLQTIAGSLDVALSDTGRAQARAAVELVRPPGAESAEQFISRTHAALAQVRADGVPLVVAHSGTHRVLCRLLGLSESVEPIANCRPVRFTPPAQPGEAWSVEMI